MLSCLHSTLYIALHHIIDYRVLLLYIYSKLLQWVASFDRSSAFLATLLILYF